MIFKDKTKIFKYAGSVIIYYGTNGIANAGIIPEGKTKIKATAIKQKDIGGETFSVGFDIEFETASMQVYDLRRFELLNNQTVTLEFYPAQMYLHGIPINVEVDASLDGNDKGMIKITGTKRVENISDCFNGKNLNMVWQDKWSDLSGGIGSGSGSVAGEVNTDTPSKMYIGAWSSSYTYTKDNIVGVGVSTYISLLDGNRGNSTTNTTYWKYIGSYAVGTTYNVGDVVRNGATFGFYKSISAGNVGKSLSDSRYWTKL